MEHNACSKSRRANGLTNRQRPARAANQVFCVADECWGRSGLLLGWSSPPGPRAPISLILLFCQPAHHIKNCLGPLPLLSMAEEG